MTRLTGKTSSSARREIAAIGNLIRHDYRRLDDGILWRIATRSFRQLKPVIQAIKAREP